VTTAMEEVKAERVARMHVLHSGVVLRCTQPADVGGDSDLERKRTKALPENMPKYALSP